MWKIVYFVKSAAIFTSQSLWALEQRGFNFRVIFVGHVCYPCLAFAFWDIDPTLKVNIKSLPLERALYTLIFADYYHQTPNKILHSWGFSILCNEYFILFALFKFLYVSVSARVWKWCWNILTWNLIFDVPLDNKCFGVLAQILKGLHFIHGRGYLHRDIKVL